RHLSPASASISPGRRIYQITMELNENSRFGPDPRSHAGAYLALWSRGTLLDNYEAHLYYFPVRFRPEFEAPPIWRRLNNDVELFAERLRQVRDQIDVLLVWIDDERLLETARAEFNCVNYHDGQLWVLSRR